MLDHKWIREHLEETRNGLISRGEFAADENATNAFAQAHPELTGDQPAAELIRKTAAGRIFAIANPAGITVPKLDDLLDLDKRRLAMLQETESLKARRNEATAEIARKKKAGEDSTETIAAMKATAERIRELDVSFRELDEAFNYALAILPNLPDSGSAVGVGEDDNICIRTVGEPTRLDFEPQDHVTLGESLDIIDLKRGAKVSGARFVFMKGTGALLERALTSFMLDLATRENGRTELMPPVLNLAHSLFGTGQLPKMAEDMFRCEGTDLYLAPTAEVPVTNYHREEVLAGAELPLRYVAYSPCFRSEAGSWGRDMRGIIRLHQFQKVELVTFCRPEDSDAEHELLLSQAEEILKRLELPYRVMRHCSGELSFAAARCFDIEVWLPSQNRYREISSCSNFRDFQARRASIRYRPQEGGKPAFVHTQNGSALAIGRTVVAILENYQQADGSIRIPTALQPYMGGIEVITQPEAPRKEQA